MFKQIKFYVSPATKIILFSEKLIKFDGSFGEKVESKKDLINVDLEPKKEYAKNKLQKLKNRLIPWMKNHKGKTALVASVVLATIGGGVYCIKREPRYVKRFKESQEKYLKEISQGFLTQDTLDSYVDSYIELKKHKRFYKKISQEYFGTLFNLLKQYTVDLLKENDVVLNDKDLPESDDVIINILNYLGEQQKLFISAT